MKKLFVLLICFVLSFGAAASAESWRVFDNAGVFSQEDIAAIEEAIADFQRATNIDFAVLTTNDYLGNDNWMTIANSFYDSMSFGFGKQASGMLYYIDMNQRIPCVSTSGEMVSIFAPYLDAAHDACHAYLSKGDYKGAVLKMLKSASEAVESTKEKDAE